MQEDVNGLGFFTLPVRLGIRTCPMLNRFEGAVTNLIFLINLDLYQKSSALISTRNEAG